MHPRMMGIDADLDGLHTDIPDSRRLTLANHDRIRLELHAELTLEPRVLENLEEVFAQKNLAAAQSQNKDTGVRHLVEQMFDLRRRHLAMIFMVEITMNTPFVAAIGQIELHAERGIPCQRLLSHLLEQSAHFESPRTIGSSDISRIPWLARSRAKVSASRSASPGSISNSAQIFC